MKREFVFDVTILGGGPAGLAAAIAAKNEGANVLLIERENKLGGILKQCIHDGFGLVYFKERLTGPEYAGRFIEKFLSLDIDYILNGFVNSIQKEDDSFEIVLQSRDGMKKIFSNSVVLACGCREKTSRQVFIHGDRPAGIFTAGTAQYFVNIMGEMPTKRCVILGSGDIGMIMARRLTLEGATVEGVYEIKDEPAGLARNVSQCLNDFSIPLHLSTTVTEVIGNKRVEAVEICSVDKEMNLIAGTERIIECDALILSVGLIPENEIAQEMSIDLDSATKGAYVDQSLMTMIDGVFSCGNALHVNDLADYVSYSGETAGRQAAKYKKTEITNRKLVKISYDKNDFLYVTPQYYDLSKGGELTLYFRPRYSSENKKISLADGEKIKCSKKIRRLTPSEMGVIAADFIESDSIKLFME